MNVKSLMILGAVGAMVLTGCSKKLTQMPADYFSVNPNPLEVVGDKVPATVTAKIPAKFFLKDAQVKVTPMLQFDGREVASQAYTFQGEKVRGNNPVISYEKGGTVTIPVMYTYEPAMMRSDLALNFEVTQGSKTYALPPVVVGNGVVATAALASASNVAPAVAPDKFQRVINEKYAADIHFLINQANIRDGQVTKEDMISLNDRLVAASRTPRTEIEEINVSSYASPDGSLDFNTRLAENREANTTAFVKDLMKRDNITEFGELTAQFTAEDWEGFQRLVAQSDIQDKNLILSVLSMYKDPEQREREIRNLSSVFSQLADEILPQLRYSRISASINVIGKSDQEILDLYQSQPTALSVDELLYAANLVDDNAAKMKIYNTAAMQNPSDYRTFNDLGTTQFRAGDIDGAKANFAQAQRLAPAALEPQMNLGLIALVNNDFRTANQKFGAAAGQEGLDEALGTYYLMVGDNNAAAKAFGNAKSNNAALAQILTKDYSKARSTLAGISNPDATTYYITAILGARTNNDTMVTNNLRQAVKLDRSLAEKAAADLEFANFNVAAIL